MATVGQSCDKVCFIKHCNSSSNAATVVCRAIVLWRLNDKDWERKQQRRAKAKDLGIDSV